MSNETLPYRIEVKITDPNETSPGGHEATVCSVTTWGRKDELFTSKGALCLNLLAAQIAKAAKVLPHAGY